jgi:tmRNA-binding protein
MAEEQKKQGESAEPEDDSDEARFAKIIAEIRRLNDRIAQDGVALIPLSLYFKDSRVKVELGLCKGKKNYDKRQADAEREASREMDRARKERLNS